MRQKLQWLMVMSAGLLLLVAAGTLSVQAAPRLDGDPPNVNADYVGSKRCATCHNGRDTAIWDAWHDTVHSQTVKPVAEATVLGDFTDEQTLMVTMPDGQRRPIQLSDVTYVIGGRFVQQYISVMERSDGTMGYYVLPIVWNIAQQEDQESTWTFFHAADWTSPERDWRVNCAGCHTTGPIQDVLNGEAEIVFADEFTSGDVEFGIGCESCHGPAGDHMGGAGELVRPTDAQVCGQCHVQGRDATDEHPYPVNYQPGLALDESALVMIDASDTDAFWSSGHARANPSQYNEWLVSQHAGSLTDVLASENADQSCLRCHAAPADATDPTPDYQITLESAVFGITCVTCHSPHSSESLPLTPLTYGGTGSEGYEIVESTAPEQLLRYAEPAGQPMVWQGEGSNLPSLLRGDAYELCISCHSSADPLTREYIEVDGSLHTPVREMFEGREIVTNVVGIQSRHASDPEGPRCVTCHMADTVEIGLYGNAPSHLMTTALPSDAAELDFDSCTSCHTDLSRRYLRRFVSETQDGVSSRLDAASLAYLGADEQEEWIATVLDFVTSDGSLGVHNYAYTDALLDAVEIELGLVQPMTTAAGMTPALDPDECAECHREEYRDWQSSPHADASLSSTFQLDYAEHGRPTYCMRCHASGFSTETETYMFEGVVCSNCHVTSMTGEHPPSPFEVADSSAVCGSCHSGAHAPTYDEWLVSSHSASGIDCTDCHAAHSNGLLLGSVNDTCGDCHEEVMTDEIHMGKDMTCTDCHMTRQTVEDGVHVIQTGHSMHIDPSLCSDCHGDVHMLSASDSENKNGKDAEALTSEITLLKQTAEHNLNYGVVGGALGALVLMGIVIFVMRVGRS